MQRLSVQEAKRVLSRTTSAELEQALERLSTDANRHQDERNAYDIAKAMLTLVIEGRRIKMFHDTELAGCWPLYVQRDADALMHALGGPR